MSSAELSGILSATTLIGGDAESTKAIGAAIGAKPSEIEDALRILGQENNEDRPDTNTAPALHSAQTDAKSAKPAAASKSNGHAAKSTAARSATTEAADASKNLISEFVDASEITSNPAKFGLVTEDIDISKPSVYADLTCDIANLGQAARQAVEGGPKPPAQTSSDAAGASGSSEKKKAPPSAKAAAAAAAAAAAKKQESERIKHCIESIAGWTIGEKKMSLRTPLYHTERLGHLIADYTLVGILDPTHAELRISTIGSLPFPVPPPYYMNGSGDRHVFYTLASVCVLLQSPPVMPTMWIKGGHLQLASQLTTFLKRQPSFNALAKKNRAAAVAAAAAAAAPPPPAPSSSSSAASAAAPAVATTAVAAAPAVVAAASTPAASPADSGAARKRKAKRISEDDDEPRVSGEFDHVLERAAQEEKEDQANKRQKRSVMRMTATAASTPATPKDDMKEPAANAPAATDTSAVTDAREAASAPAVPETAPSTPAPPPPPPPIPVAANPTTEPPSAVPEVEM